jgi:hypothetical protein
MGIITNAKRKTSRSGAGKGVSAKMIFVEKIAAALKNSANLIFLRELPHCTNRG